MLLLMMLLLLLMQTGEVRKSKCLQDPEHKDKGRKKGKGEEECII